MSWFESESHGLMKPGKYEANIFDFKFDVFGNAATNTPPSMSIQYKLDSNKRLWQNFKFDEKGKKWLLWQMGALGLTDLAKMEVKSTGEPSVIDVAKAYFEASKKIIGQRVEIEVSHNTFTGRDGQERTVEAVKILAVIDQPNVAAPFKMESPIFNADEKIPF